MRYRIGQGFDFHPLVAGRRLVLGGVEIPHDKGLKGHSDADVAAHALSKATHATPAPTVSGCSPSCGTPPSGADGISATPT
jgi:2-C-methyl-D-erythritol 2,4-cyclodiphosphate synthase